MSVPTLDATLAGPSANSYASVATADAYLSLRPGGAPAWDAANGPTREVALMRATLVLERESWAGVRATGDQRLAWPRTGVDVFLVPILPTEIPPEIITAVAELAVLSLAGTGNVDPAAPTGAAKIASLVSQVKAGPVDVKFSAGAIVSATEPGSTLPLVVRQLVWRYLRSLIPARVSSIPVVRVS